MIAYDSPGVDYGTDGPSILQALAVAVERGATHVGTAAEVTDSGRCIRLD